MMDTPKNASLSALQISEIRSRECLRRFDCGVADIDSWASEKAFRRHQQDRTKVFCARLGPNGPVVGFYSLSLSAIGSKLLLGQHGDRYPEGYAPFIYIDWLAVIRPHQGDGIGRFMLVNALERALLVSHHLPFYGIALRSLNNKKTHFYNKMGFAQREDGPHPLMILPIWTVRDLFGELQ
jgi:GNAT superfamily N-acetyltransferase